MTEKRCHLSAFEMLIYIYLSTAACNVFVVQMLLQNKLKPNKLNNLIYFFILRIQRRYCRHHALTVIFIFSAAFMTVVLVLMAVNESMSLLFGVQNVKIHCCYLICLIEMVITPRLLIQLCLSPV